MMKTPQELLQERKERLKKTIAFEQTDRTPVIIAGDAVFARHVGMKLSEFVSNMKASHQAILSSFKDLGDVDGTGSTYATATIFPLIFYSKVKLPGRELPDNTPWQLDERELMTVADYDTILNKGWKAFSDDYLKNRVGFDLDSIREQLKDVPNFIKDFEDAGIVVYSPKASSTVNEFLGGGRSFPKFMRDMFKMPDKVEAVLDVILEENLAELRQQIRAIKPMVVFMSPARGASEFYSPKIWQRFVWKYLKAAAEAIIEEGAIADLHIDGNWERDLEFFKTLPKHKCIFESDGATNIYKVREVLGDHMCIKGDVPAAMLALGTPDDVYNYSTKLIKDMGKGFILASGCTIPPNAKFENVKAMVAAASGK
ncbi:uroporphyrinogen decarboxylase family protein [Sporomusa acidovorans]|uniref:Uroporphyrinogen decarboxylase (URO-D) domain-containing protein n=1 Tax=Sporomusa acidovorans (strain ATCC 49682 / DSM 3132 / Mol) TaxID=1123286 RepID=A0ABZ3J9U2_SPOA4|nr:uroporphyrinogen decarboxylase family protein [Sporomusa acidovorans]OZC16205.1 uroporphyrinogen decarboxylase [Sporomusa acidovorans DSM 3132]SDE31255.1 Uroporphyrinogen decarboxylase (URO-D) [Sporomusa acidovorans]